MKDQEVGRPGGLVGLRPEPASGLGHSATIPDALAEALKPFAKIPLCYQRRGSKPSLPKLDTPAPGGAYTAADVLRARKLLP